MNSLNDISSSALSVEQWFLLFALAITVLVISNFVSMISLWLVNSRLKEISDTLNEKKAKD